MKGTMLIWDLSLFVTVESWLFATVMKFHLPLSSLDRIFFDIKKSLFTTNEDSCLLEQDLSPCELSFTGYHCVPEWYHLTLTIYLKFRTGLKLTFCQNLRSTGWQGCCYYTDYKKIIATWDELNWLYIYIGKGGVNINNYIQISRNRIISINTSV